MPNLRLDFTPNEEFVLNALKNGMKLKHQREKHQRDYQKANVVNQVLKGLLEEDDPHTDDDYSEKEAEIKATENTTKDKKNEFLMAKRTT